MTKNYYKILGISESSTEQEIKTAYRRLARKWHPDIAGNTDEAVRIFKEINEAYEVLSDKTKRAEYDTINRFYNYSSTKSTTEDKKEKKENTTRPDKPEFNKTEQKHNDNNNSSTGFNFKWEDFLSKYREYSKKYENTKKEEKNIHYGNQVKGKDINTDVEITIAEAINGTSKIINMISTQVCHHCNGRNFINGTICKHCKGKGTISEHKRFTIKLPAGIKDNSRIRLAGEGEKGINGGKNGDLYVTVHIKAPLDYKTDGNNIIKTLTLTPYEAVLGGNINVKTLDGNITVKISPNTQNGQKIRLSGCGLNINGKIGDMILTVEIQIPKNLSDIEIELYKKLSQVASQNVK